MTITHDISRPLRQLDGVTVKELFGAGAAWVERHAPYINSLNVFPVPDGDSGTNMLLTMQAAMREVDHSPSHSAGVILTALSHGALLGARGNSGVILSQILRGIARSVDGRETINATELAFAMGEGSRTAYNGVVKPVEGTILTVIRESSDEAMRAAAESDDIVRMMDRTVEAARRAVANTPQLLPILKQAGVVDAGGEGLLVILEGALKYLQGEPIEEFKTTAGPYSLSQFSRPDGWGYDIQFHIRGPGLNVDEIRERIAKMGESALIVGDDSLVKVHVHAPNPGDIIGYGADQGPLVNVIIENMQEQYADFASGSTADRRVGAENLGAIEGRGRATSSPTVPPVRAEQLLGIGTVAVAPGAGLAEIFRSLGVGAIVKGGPTMNPSTEDLLYAVDQVSADQLLILPNDKNIIFAAEQVKQLSGKKIAVIPTKTVPQGVAALLAFNYQSDFETNARLMIEAATRVRTVEVTSATRSARLEGLAVKEGQFVGLIDGELVKAGDDRDLLTTDLLKLAGAHDAELVTIYYGDQVSPAEANRLQEKLGSAFPDLEIQIHSGGQPLYPYIISVE